MLRRCSRLHWTVNPGSQLRATATISASVQVKAALRPARSVAVLVRDAIRNVVLKPRTAGPVAIWDGERKRASIDHDSVHDQP